MIILILGLQVSVLASPDIGYDFTELGLEGNTCEAYNFDPSIKDQLVDKSLNLSLGDQVLIRTNKPIKLKSGMPKTVSTFTQYHYYKEFELRGSKVITVTRKIVQHELYFNLTLLPDQIQAHEFLVLNPGDELILTIESVKFRHITVRSNSGLHYQLHTSSRPDDHRSIFGASFLMLTQDLLPWVNIARDGFVLNKSSVYPTGKKFCDEDKIHSLGVKQPVARKP